MNQYSELFSSQRDLLNQHAAPLLNAAREQAAQAFERLGFPSRKVEDYRYTHVEEAFAPNYGLNLSRIAIPTNPYEVFHCDVPNLSTSLYFVVNDAFYQAALPKATLPEGVLVMSLCQAAQQYPHLVEKYYGRLADVEKDSITALNTMFCQDGLFIYLPAGTKLPRPIQVVNIMHSSVPLMANRRVLIVAEDDSEACILFCDHCADDIEFLSTQVIETFVSPRAHIDIYELEETHAKNHRFSNFYAQEDEGAAFTHAALTLTCGLTRNHTHIKLTAPEAEVNLYGCAITDAEQHVDNNTLIEHLAPACRSNQLYKYVVDGKSQGAFAGRIFVQKDAQKTESQETNANLVCTPEARMWTQPMLEIYADDVKCAHGSTVGQLSADALFYMQQRGISEAEARLLLKQAFAADVLKCITLEALRDRLQHLIEKRFRGELNHCQGCNLCK